MLLLLQLQDLLLHLLYLTHLLDYLSVLSILLMLLLLDLLLGPASLRACLHQVVTDALVDYSDWQKEWYNV